MRAPSLLLRLVSWIAKPLRKAVERPRNWWAVFISFPILLAQKDFDTDYE
jgi:hypothetical protein